MSCHAVFQKVRHFGFAHPRYRIDQEWLKMLVTVTLSLVYVLWVAAKPLPIPTILLVRTVAAHWRTSADPEARLAARCL